jgi:hypothetical protein
LIRSLDFASCYVYSPAGRGAIAIRSRAVCASLKSGDPDFLRRSVARVRLEAANQPGLAEYFAPSAVLVPVPGSCPRTDGDPWIAELLATELLRTGVGCLILKALKRVHPVRKSASAAPGSRTSVTKHFESFAIEPRVRDGDTDVTDILLVDDVVTKGRTLLAAASRLHEAHPTARIRAFALLRTLGFAAELQGLLQPCIGEIRWARGDARRNP